jgi:hypothetical protein
MSRLRALTYIQTENRTNSNQLFYRILTDCPILGQMDGESAKKMEADPCQLRAHKLLSRRTLDQFQI